MISYKYHKFFKYLGITILSIIGVFILLLMLLNLAIKPQNVQNLVERYSKEFLNAEIKTDTIEIHLLRNFPYASLSVKDCKIRSLAFESLDSISRTLVPIKADSLAEIGRLNISVSLVDLFFDKLSIKGIELESPQIYGYISQFGISNWDILKPDTNTTESEDSTSFDINITKLSISQGAQISFCSVPDSIIADFSLNELLLKGKLSNSIKDNYITNARLSNLVLAAEYFKENTSDSTYGNSFKFTIDTLDINKNHNSNKAEVDIRMRTDIQYHGITMARNIPFGVQGIIELSDKEKEKLGVSLEDFTVYVATLPVKMNGNLLISDNGIEIPKLDGNINNYNIKNILEYIPEQFLNSESIETDAAITLQTQILGRYMFEGNELPKVDLSFEIPSSSLTISDTKNGKKESFKNIEASANLHFDQNDPDNNILNISKLAIEGYGLLIDVTGKILQYTKDPVIDIKVKSNINLDSLSTIMPMNIIANGSAEGHLSLKGKGSTLNLFSLSQNDIDAKFTTKSLRFKMEDMGIDFNCGNTSLQAGVMKNSKDSLLTKGNRIFSIGLSLDTILLNYKDSMFVSGTKISLSANQEPPATDKSKKPKHMPLIKIDGNLNLGGVTIIDQDSSRIRLRGSKNAFSITPWTDGKTPVIAFDSKLQMISLVGSGSRIFAHNSDLSLKVITHSPRRRSKADTSTIKRDTVRTLRTSSDTVFKSKRLLRTALKYWEISGNIKFANGRIITPYFPLRTRISNFNLNINNDGLNFQDTKLAIGKSLITLSGKLQGLIKAVTEHKKLSFTGSIISDSLDINQILQASANSRTVSMTDNRSDEAIETAMENAINSDTSSMKSPVIPEFLDANIKLNLNNVKFKKDKLNSVQGNLIAHNSIFLLNKFKVVTDDGWIDLNAFYAASKIDDVSLGFDMKMDRFEVADLIEFIPNVDSLLPMMHSFRGKITCSVSGMTKVDSLLNVNFETINGLLSLEGEDIILMDGETFAEIAKMLKFKNKEKNLIDRISVQCVASDNRIEIFPFVIEMDRYKAAVSGTQNMDMSFKYHISVLKSPIPFKIGLNISGTTDDMKFRIGKCQYKNENVPVYTQVMDSARINLGEQIRGVLFNGVEKTFKNSGTERLAKTAEKEQEKTNGMENLSDTERQQLDSTDIKK